ncbi:DUF3662 domain-containing protein [Streptomyces xantholiticus]|uniref:DUF3662 domain-containing protein n=1 Tax=Streptomyces xantholiticus TaxID=68285 RepID=A0ABV1UMN0_9ACTN|nr:forkhead-associated protein [Streptomyces peucetius subsp. caesius ATCC 27952]
MGTLIRWERALERWQDALLAKAFRSEQVELLDALRHECDSHAVVCSQSRVVVPNAYEVELDPDVYRELRRRGGRVGQALTDVLVRHGDANRYEWAGPLTVRVVPSAGLPNGRYRVTSSVMHHVRVDAFA